MRKRILLPLACLSVAMLANPTKAQKTFYVDEVTNYADHGCEFGSLSNLNTVTATLVTAMTSAGWTGNNFVNSNAWPQDFVESCDSSYSVGGPDEFEYADSRTVAVFAGHGNTGRLSFGYPHGGSNCRVYFEPNMRVGSMDNNDAGYGIYLASIVLKVSDLPDGPNWQWLRQQMGFNNSPAIGDNEPRDFFNATSSTPNSTAWLNQMDGDGREPVVVSHGTNQSNCWSIHDTAKLKGNVSLSPVSGGPSCLNGQPAFYYCYEWVDVP